MVKLLHKYLSHLAAEAFLKLVFQLKNTIQNLYNYSPSKTGGHTKNSRYSMEKITIYYMNNKPIKINYFVQHKDMYIHSKIQVKKLLVTVAIAVY